MCWSRICRIIITREECSSFCPFHQNITWNKAKNFLQLHRLEDYFPECIILHHFRPDTLTESNSRPQFGILGLLQSNKGGTEGGLGYLLRQKYLVKLIASKEVKVIFALWGENWQLDTKKRHGGFQGWKYTK